jgi:hypothetical protein
VRACALHKTEQIKVGSYLIEKGFVYLAQTAQDPKAAFGILKMAFRNEVPFIAFEKGSLVSF